MQFLDRYIRNKKFEWSLLLLPLNVTIYSVSYGYASLLWIPVVIPIGLILFIFSAFSKKRKDLLRGAGYVVLILVLLLYVASAISHNIVPVIYYGPFVVSELGRYRYFSQVMMFLFIALIALLLPNQVTSFKWAVNFATLSRYFKLKYVKVAVVVLLIVISVGYALVPPTSMGYTETYQNTLKLETSGGVIFISYRVSYPTPFSSSEHVHISLLFSVEEVHVNSPYVIDVIIVGLKLDPKNISDDTLIVKQVSLDSISLIVPLTLLKQSFSLKISFITEVVTVAIPYYEAHEAMITIKA